LINNKRGDIANFYYKQNRIQQIRGFITVVQEGTIAKASEVLKQSPASIVNQIQSLEEMLGMKLFKKDGRNIVLTQKGKKLYDMSLPVYKSVTSLYEEFTELDKKENSNKLEIHAHISVISLVIPKVLQSLGDNFQYENLQLTYTPKQEAINNVLSQECDMAIFPFEKHERVDTTSIEMIPLFSYKPVIVFKKDFILAKKKDNEITFEDIGNAGQFFHVGKNSISNIQANRLEEGVLKSKIGFENCTWDTLKPFVKQGLGTMIMHKGYLTEEDKKELDFKAIDNLSSDIKYCALLRKNVYIKPEIPVLCKTIQKLFGSED
jgi:DNA-binding transcriptional LysR family regulator